MWIFKGTGRRARVIRLDSTAKQDTVLFRFLDEHPSIKPRSANARVFLCDFILEV